MCPLDKDILDGLYQKMLSSRVPEAGFIFLLPSKSTTGVLRLDPISPELKSRPTNSRLIRASPSMLTRSNQMWHTPFVDRCVLRRYQR
jgi:hypothetical protein